MALYFTAVIGTDKTEIYNTVPESLSPDELDKHQQWKQRDDYYSSRAWIEKSNVDIYVSLFYIKPITVAQNALIVECIGAYLHGHLNHNSRELIASPRIKNLDDDTLIYQE